MFFARRTGNLQGIYEEFEILYYPKSWSFSGNFRGKINKWRSKTEIFCQKIGKWYSYNLKVHEIVQVFHCQYLLFSSNMYVREFKGYPEIFGGKYCFSKFPVFRKVRISNFTPNLFSDISKLFKDRGVKRAQKSQVFL